MKSSNDRLLNRPRLTALVLVAGGVLGLLAACSSDGNPTPGKPPVVNTGGGGSGGNTSSGGGENEAGESSGGSAQGGRAHGGGSQGGRANVGDAGEGGGAGEGGEAGAAPVDPSCPTTDLGFLNQPSNSQKSVFDNTKRLGAHATLPPLP
jgi:hypothetical protein